MKFSSPLELWCIVAWGLVSTTSSTKIKNAPLLKMTTMKQLFSNRSESPNIMDVFERLPGQKGTLISKNNKGAKKVAVCLAGHLRTFIEPGVYSAFAKNLAQEGVSVDTYVVGHLGSHAGNPWAKQHGLDYQQTHANLLENANSSAIQMAMKFPGLNVKKTLVTKGDCAALEAAWHADGVTGRSCRKPYEIDSNFMQIMWLDRCVHMVRTSGVAYDLLVRTRPDVGVFQPIDYSSLSLTAISFMDKEDGVSKADWFWTMPMSMVNAWWDRIVKDYVQFAEPGGYPQVPSPDFYIFNQGALTLTQFPAVIVRSPSEVECFRLMDSGLRNACKGLGDGYFGNTMH